MPAHTGRAAGAASAQASTVEMLRLKLAEEVSYNDFSRHSLSRIKDS